MTNRKAGACGTGQWNSQMPSYTRAQRVRQDVLATVGYALKEWLHGHGLPIAEIHEVIEARIDAEINEAVQDALREIRPDD
jgi:hypothetical protein